MRTRILTAALLLASLAAACCASAPPPPGHPDAVTGTATYRERMALPEGAVLRVLLLDIDAPDVPDWIVARSEGPVPGQVPLEFSVGYDPHAIVEGVQYGVSAEILVGGEVWFATPEPVPVLTKGAPDRVDLLLRRAH